MVQRVRVAAVLVLCVLMSASALAAEKAAEKKGEKAPRKKAPPKAKTYTVEVEPLRIDIVLGGVFEAKRMSEVSRAPKAWKQMKVLWAAEPGTAVKKGDVLVKLDTEDLDRTIKDIEAGKALGDLAWKQAGEDLRLLQKITKEELAKAKVAKKRAEEDFAHFKKGVAPFRPKYAAVDAKWTDLWLETVLTEHRELKRMYEADDLVESTEGLVLKRQELRVEKEKIDHEKDVKFTIPWRTKVQFPRTIEDQKKKLRDAAIALDRTTAGLTLGLEKKKLEIAKMKYDRARAAEHLAKLQADRKTMIIHAPAGGVVYYGKCVRGEWKSVGKAAAQLREGGQLGAYNVFMTIVGKRGIFVRAGAAEQHLRDLRKGDDAQITPTGYPDNKLEGEIKSITIQPGGPERYTVRISVPGRRLILPGMTCTVRLIAYQKKKAITVPVGAVFAEPDDPDSRYVYLKAAEDKKPEKRPVTVGRTKNGKLEITKGLAKGDVILLKEPAK